MASLEEMSLLEDINYQGLEFCALSITEVMPYHWPSMGYAGVEYLGCTIPDSCSSNLGLVSFGSWRLTILKLDGFDLIHLLSHDLILNSWHIVLSVKL